MARHSTGEFGDFTIPQGLGKKIAVIGVVIAGLIMVAGSTGTVGAGQRGVLLRFEAVTGEVKGEGLYFKIPFVEDVALMSTQLQKYTAPTVSALSKDLQMVNTEVTLNYQLDAGSVGEIYRTMRQDYESRVIQPYIQEAVKSTTADFDAEELITQRPQVKDELQNLMAERLAPLIVVVQLSITDFQFSTTFQESIEAKVKAVQEALEAENALRRVEFEAKQAVTRAEAEAKGLELQKAQITEQLLDLRRIEVQGRAIEKWNGVMPTVVTSGGPVPMLDVFSARQ